MKVYAIIDTLNGRFETFKAYTSKGGAKKSANMDSEFRFGLLKFTDLTDEAKEKVNTNQDYKLKFSDQTRYECREYNLEGSSYNVV